MTVTTATVVTTSVFSSPTGLTVQDVAPAQSPGGHYLVSNAGLGEARSVWSAGSFPTSVQIGWQQVVAVGDAAPSSATADGELLVQLAATSPTLVRIDLSRTFGATAGSIVPSFGIDIGDDGVFELAENTLATTTIPAVVLGPVPLAVRLRGNLAQFGPGNIDLNLQIVVTPENSLAISAAAPGCSSSGVLIARPAFQGAGIEFLGGPAPQVVVIGLSAQSALLPGLPPQCVLVPAPDLLFFMATYGTMTLPLPAAVRPVVFWAQGVALEPAGLVPTNGHTVFAL